MSLDRDLRSRASINGHPLHPMLVTFPIAFLVAAAVSDVLFMTTEALILARFALWLLIGGGVMGALAALAGLIDFVAIKHARVKPGWIHLTGNIAVLVIATANALIRLAHSAAVVTPVELALSLVTVLILAVTGWMGGELVFRHKIGQINSAE